MSTDHPFQQLFENFGRLPDSHSDSVNRIPREKLKGWLDAPIGKPGHCFLLKAPRAGHGKTHLLTRLLHDLGGSHEFVPLHAVGGSRIDAATVLDDTLRRLVRGLPAAGGLTVLDLVARRLFSMALQPLVNSGEVPCQDREAALVALRDRPVETFDFHHPGAVTAHWAKENFELLGPRLALEISQRNGLSLREVSFWVDAMFRFSATQIDNPSRVRTLAAQVFDSPSAEAVANERLVALLGMLTTLLRVVLVADELEGFSLDESGALRFASFVCALRQSVERVDVIISVNQDIWDNAFVPRLSAGLADRLSELSVEIEPLDRKGVIAVIESRVPGEGERIAAGISATHARGVIREAAELWGRKDSLEPIIPAFGEPEAPNMDEVSARAEIPVEPPVVVTPEVEAVGCEPPVHASAALSEPPPHSPAPNAEAFAWPAPNLDIPPAFPGHDGSAPIAPSIAASASSPVSFDGNPSSHAEVRPVQTPPPFAPEPAAGFAESSPPFAPEPLMPTFDTSSPPFAPEPIAPSFQPAPPPVFPEPVAPAFQPSPPSFVPEPLSPPFQAAPQPAPEASTDRVDDLLRQFRERYGKS
ncbi:MAG: hypothetical protein RLZZ505_426 [Verrucomicrobiota bacterium]